MTALWLVLAGIGAGLAGSIAGLASLVSYPALLAAGLSPVAANVTNTLALVGGTLGSVSASRSELHGQAPRLRRLLPAALVGGAVGAALLLLTPSDTFEKIVPVLIGLASAAVVVRRRPGAVIHRHATGWLTAATFAVGIYGGYFGAAAGVLLLALVLYATGDSLPRSNAVKNVVLGAANLVAAVGFALFGPVAWWSALPLAAGFFVGGQLGPRLVRRVPATPLRLLIGAAGIGLAVHLGLAAYR